MKALSNFLSIQCVTIYGNIVICFQCNSQTIIDVDFSEGVIIGTRKLLDLPLKELGLRNNDNLESLEFANGGPISEAFQLHPTFDGGGDGGIKFVHIETVRQLDRETKSRYRLNLRASRRGSPAPVLFQLNVNVLDINDNPPVFDIEEYNVSVNKSLDSSSLHLLSIHAEDEDEGANGKVSYSLQKEMETYFHIDEENGNLSAKRSLICRSSSSSNNCLDCIKAQLCSLLIYAKDQGQPQQSAYTVVKVHILDSNDHDPAISLRYFPDQSQPFSLLNPSSLSPNSSVAAITVTDQDSGIYGQTDLKIVSGNEQKHFHLNSFGNNLYLSLIHI